MTIDNMAIGFKGFGCEAVSDMNRAQSALSGRLLAVTIRPPTPMRSKARIQGDKDMTRFSHFTWPARCSAVPRSLASARKRYRPPANRLKGHGSLKLRNQGATSLHSASAPLVPMVLTWTQPAIRRNRIITAYGFASAIASSCCRRCSSLATKRVLTTASSERGLRLP
jgi:hypothetical protein